MNFLRSPVFASRLLDTHKRTHAGVFPRPMHRGAAAKGFRVSRSAPRFRYSFVAAKILGATQWSTQWWSS